MIPNQTSRQDSAAAVLEAEDRIIDVIDELISFWGFKGINGRIWTVLYLSPRPMTMEEMQDRLGLSVGSVSMALKELRAWGVVLKSRGREERRTVYHAETNFWKMIAQVLDDRERRLVNRSTESLEGAARALSELAKSAPGEEARDARYRASRAKRLALFGAAAMTLLEAFLLNRKVDASPLAKFAALPLEIVRALGGERRNRENSALAQSD